MGLSICYNLKIAVSEKKARELVRDIHHFAKNLSVERVFDIIEFNGPESTKEHYNYGSVYQDRTRTDGRTESVSIPPVKAFQVVIWPAQGAESAAFGLASHPAFVQHRESVFTLDEDGHETCQIEAGDPIEYETHLSGWFSWFSGCKTQYAGSPQYGGTANFLRAHQSIVRILDHCADLGITVDANDDSGYWKDRDEKRLVDKLNEWNELIAGFAGRLKDKMGDAPIVAPIMQRPDFEHLEARADQKMRKPRKSS